MRKFRVKYHLNLQDMDAPQESPAMVIEAKTDMEARYMYHVVNGRYNGSWEDFRSNYKEWQKMDMGSTSCSDVTEIFWRVALRGLPLERG